MEKSLNHYVPDSVIIKQYKEEIVRLKQKLENQDKAIEAFKKWQSRVAERNVHYWLNEGLKFLSKEFSNEDLKDIRNLHNIVVQYKSKLKQMKRYRELKEAFDSLMSKYISLNNKVNK